MRGIARLQVRHHLQEQVDPLARHQRRRHDQVVARGDPRRRVEPRRVDLARDYVHTRCRHAPLHQVAARAAAHDHDHVGAPQDAQVERFQPPVGPGHVRVHPVAAANDLVRARDQVDARAPPQQPAQQVDQDPVRVHRQPHDERRAAPPDRLGERQRAARSALHLARSRPPRGHVLLRVPGRRCCRGRGRRSRRLLGEGGHVAHAWQRGAGVVRDPDDLLHLGQGEQRQQFGAHEVRVHVAGGDDAHGRLTRSSAAIAGS